MAVDISFESNLREWTASMSDVERRQLPFATAKALTDVARYDVKPAVERRIDQAFDKPVRFTQQAVAYHPAHKATLVSRVFVKDIQRGYLGIQQEGGVRRATGRALAIPVRQERNSYGNLPRGTIKRLLARKDTFSGRVNGYGAIWQRQGRNLKLLVAWKEQAGYRPRFGFYEAARTAAQLHFPRRFEAAMSQALATAR